MRDIIQTVLDEIDYSRTFDAKLKVYDNHLYFEEKDARVKDAQISEDIYSYDACTYSDGILRVASVDVSGTTYLFTQWVSDPHATTWPNWVNQSIEIGKHSKPGVFDNRIFYLKKTGAETAIIEWGDYNTSTGVLDNTTSIDKSMDPDQPTAISPVTSTAFYVHTNKFEPDVSDVNYGYIFYFKYNGPTSSDYIEKEHPGAIYGNNQHTHYFDAERLNNLDYIHLTDLNEKRGIYLTSYWGTAWSDIKPVYPLDAVDDTSLFTPSFITTLDGRLFVTGILKRTAGMAMQMFTIGPEHFTAGRELYIGTRGTDEFSLYYESAYHTCPAMGGKLHLVGNILYYVGPGILYSATSKSIVGGSTSITEYAVNNVSLTQERTGSGIANMEIYNSEAERPPVGSIGELEIAYSDIWAKIATIDIDTAPKRLAETGAASSIVGRLKAIKALTQWQSDASYDYWSQTKQANCPTTREENIISVGMGDWMEDKDDNSAYLGNVNKHGIMYGVARASRGMMVNGKFFYPTATEFYPKYGVVMHYHIETKANAAERLGIDISDIEDDQIGHYGIIVLWGKKEYNDGPGIGIYLLHGNPDKTEDWIKMTSYSLSIPVDTWHWLRAEYLNGEIKVWYRLDSSTSWTSVGTCRSEFYTDDIGRIDYLPFKNEEGSGRAGLYMYNGAGTDEAMAHTITPGFSSTDENVPIIHNPVDREIPSDAIIQVDNEQILLDGRTDLPVMQIMEDGTFDEVPTRWIAGYEEDDYWEIMETAGNKVAYCNGEQTAEAFMGIMVYALEEGVDYRCAFTISDYVSGSVRLDCGYNPADTGTWRAGNGFYSETLTLPVEDLRAMILWGNSTFKGKIDNVRVYREADVLAGTLPDWLVEVEQRATGGMLVRDAPNGSFEPPFTGFDIMANWVGVDKGRAYYDGCVVIGYEDDDGLDGTGNNYEVVDYMHEAPDAWSPNQSYDPPDHWVLHIGDLAHGEWVDQDMKVWFVDRHPIGMQGDGRLFCILNALHIAERGYNNTDPVKHAPGTKVSVISGGRVKCSWWEIYSTEQDMTFEWIATELARKAGILDVYTEKTLEDTLISSHAGWDLDTDGSTQELRPNGGIIRFKITSGAEVGIMAPYEGGLLTGDWSGPLVTITAGDVIKYYDVDTEVLTLKQSLAYTAIPSSSWITMSFQENYVSVWINDKLATAFYTGQTPKSIMFVSNGASEIDVDWSALDLRVDNFIFDMGANGPSLMSQLIKQKRIYFQDTQDGDLRIFKSREIVNTVGTPNLLAASGGDTEVDPNRASRVRLEGAEFAEILDETQMQEWGNIFRLLNSEELDTPEQFVEEAQLILADIALSTKRTTYVGAADPRIEPHDELWINLSDDEGSKKVVIRQATFQINVSGDNATFDMTLETENG